MWNQSRSVPIVALVGAPLLAASCSTARPPASADAPIESPISTDRPGFLFAPTVVPHEVVQIEAGIPTYTLVRESGDEFHTWNAPGAALRYGVTEKLELRATLPSWNVVNVNGNTDDRDRGLGDSEVGAKLALPELAGGPLALQGGMRVPTGETGFTTDEVGFSGYLLHGRDLGKGFWLQTLAGIVHTPVRDDDDLTNGALAALVSHALAEGWTGAVELTALPGLNNLSGQSYAGAFVTWTITPDLQLDMGADFGLGDHSTNVIATAGISWRF